MNSLLSNFMPYNGTIDMSANLQENIRLLDYHETLD